MENSVKENSKPARNLKTLVKQSVEAEPPSRETILALLNKTEPIARRVCEVLKEGLFATKPVVLDGEIFNEKDFEVRRKYAEMIIAIMDEKKDAGAGQGQNVSFHQINVILSKSMEEAFSRYKQIGEEKYKHINEKIKENIQANIKENIHGKMGSEKIA